MRILTVRRYQIRRQEMSKAPRRPGVLLVDALHRSWRNTAEVTSVGVIAEAIDDSARDFYLHHGFVPMLEQPRKLFIAMGTIQKLFR